ncbi:hypothetical protein H4219_002453 [Mycoemilia scoparia]|uniref:Uncharacterized protein n=1 Tax=Mycoemilia scoparia TaxID=417184 RepID=A0A9W8A143_9FUNG|nr:hypothetical protein H4219_002453 [Mycoemilia scoparia]
MDLAFNNVFYWLLDPVNPMLQALLFKRAPQSNDGSDDLDSSDDSLSPGATTTDVHGMFNAIMGKWVYVEFALDITSIVLSVVVIAIVVSLFFIKREVALRPSFRLSAWIAAMDIIMSSAKIVKLFNEYMSKIPVGHVKFINFALMFTSVAFVFLTDCIVLQLQLAVLHNKGHIAAMLNPYYEAVSILAAFIVTQPTLYVFKDVVWLPEYQIIYTSTSNSEGIRIMWGTFMAWMVGGIGYMLIICFFLVLKLMPMLIGMKTKKVFNHPEPSKEQIEQSRSSSRTLGMLRKRFGRNKKDPGNNESGRDTGDEEKETDNSGNTVNGNGTKGPNDQKYPGASGGGMNHTQNLPTTHVTDRHRRHVRNTILRIMLYPLVPIITRTIAVVTQITQLSPLPVYLLSTLLPASQGILNFIAFMFNPSIGEFWRWFLNLKYVKKAITFRIKVTSYHKELPPSLAHTKS